MAKTKPKFTHPSTLRDAVRSSIRDAILRGQLAPQAAINQAEFAREYGISRGPLREALSSLEEEGLVQNIPHHGTTVTEFNERTIVQTFSLRQILEAYALEQAMRFSVSGLVAELQAIAENMAAALERDDLDAFHECDIAFHRQIYLQADNDLLLQMWTTLETNVKRGLYFHTFTAAEPGEMLTSHQKIVKVIATGDIEAAQHELDIQLENACDILLKQWTQHEVAD